MASSDDAFEESSSSVFQAVHTAPFVTNESFQASTSTRRVLEEHWSLAVQCLLTDTYHSLESSMKWFGRLWELHTGETRHYHTVVHLEEMLGFFKLLCEHQHSLIGKEEEPVIRLAIFFHDAIYNAKSSTSEEDSANLFESFAKETGIDSRHPNLKETVMQYILATKKHEVSAENQPALALFLDLDMAVLGKKEQAYMKYAALIRKEYEFVPPDIYCEKRAQILESFLEQHKIYGTTLFEQCFEEQARKNVGKEIEILKKGEIP